MAMKMSFNKTALESFVKTKLEPFLDPMRSPVAVVREFINSAARDNGSKDQRSDLMRLLLVELEQALINDNFSKFINKLSEAIRCTQADSSGLKKNLIEIMEYMAKLLMTYKIHAEAAKVATCHADENFNLASAEDFKRYSQDRIANSMLNKVKEFATSESFEVRKMCALWGNYLGERFEFCHERDNSAGYIGNYFELFADMSVVLDNPIDDALRELIIKHQQSILTRFSNEQRFSHITHFWQAVLGFTRPISDKDNQQSYYPALQDRVKHQSSARLDILPSLQGEQDKTEETQERARELVQNARRRLEEWEQNQKEVRDQNKIAIFTNTIKVKLTDKILASRVLNSGFLPLPKGKIGALGDLGIKLVSQIPGADSAVGAIRVGIQKLDEHVVGREFRNVGHAVQSIAEIDDLALKVAERVTLRYIQQISMLALDKDAEMITIVANCAVERIFEFIKSGRYKAAVQDSFSLEERAQMMAMAISDTSLFHGLKIPVINVGVSEQTLMLSVVTPQTNYFSVEEMFYCPGIVVITDGNPAYFFNPSQNIAAAAGLMKIKSYGFMVGTSEEVKKWNLIPVTGHILDFVPEQHPGVEYLASLSHQTEKKSLSKVAENEKTMGVGVGIAPLVLARPIPRPEAVGEVKISKPVERRVSAFQSSLMSSLEQEQTTKSEREDAPYLGSTPIDALTPVNPGWPSFFGTTDSRPYPSYLSSFPTVPSGVLQTLLYPKPSELDTTSHTLSYPILPSAQATSSLPPSPTSSNKQPSAYPTVPRVMVFPTQGPSRGDTELDSDSKNKPRVPVSPLY